MMKVLVASPLDSRSYENLEAFFLVSVEGELGILSGHAAIVCALKSGSSVRLVSSSRRFRLRLGEGSFLRFRNDEGVIVTRSFTEEGGD